MKKIIILMIMAITFCCITACLADSQTETDGIPEQRDTIRSEASQSAGEAVLSDYEVIEREPEDMRLEDYPQTQAAYTESVPSAYFNPAARQGQMIRVEYESVDYTAGADERITKPAYVYLPYGYDEDDENTRYDILYLMHGWTMTAGDFFGDGYREESSLINILDNMIENGDIKPLVVVSVTFDAENAPQDFGRSVKELSLFHNDFRNNLVPFIESNFHTYAEAVTEDGLAASRGHRAFGGFSLGAVTTWYQFIYNLDYVKYFLPMSGDCWVLGTYGGRYHPVETTEYLETLITDNGYAEDDFYVCSAIGTSDPIWYQVDNQMQAMLQSSIFTEKNLHYAVKRQGQHDMNAVQEYIYNAVPMFFQ